MTCPLLLLISLDGFLWSYLQTFGSLNFPNFSHLISQGVLAEHLDNVFLTKTFPNHHTLVTGLFEESHGIINNNMYDPLLNATFAPGNNDKTWWDTGAEPIWITNQKHSLLDKPSCLHKSAVIMWPGSEALIKGEYPSYREKYSAKMTLKEKFDKVLSFILDEKYNLGIVYHDQPDQVGHLYGPNSIEVKNKLIELDNDIGYFLKKMENLNLKDSLNVILTSDHGMATINNTIILSNYVNLNGVKLYGSSPTWHLFPQSTEDLELLFSQLSHIPNLKVYMKENIPSEWNYKRSRRIGHILIVGELGYHISPTKNVYFNKGNHGFDNSYSESWPIFIAKGPNFKQNFTSKALKTIDVYSLMCHILQIEPSPNNGTIYNISHILKDTYISTTLATVSIAHIKAQNNNQAYLFNGLPFWLLVTISVLAFSLLCAVFIFVVYKLSHPVASFRHSSRLLYAVPPCNSYSPNECVPLNTNSPPALFLDDHYGLSEPRSESYHLARPSPARNREIPSKNVYRPVDFIVP